MFTGTVARIVAAVLAAWAGGLVLPGYALVFSALASATTLRRDIT